MGRHARAQSDATAAKDLEARFKRELVLARQVTHKYVVRIHDLGEIDGIKYITMSFADGIDLATLLKTEGKLAVPAVVRLARAVVSGLVAAHEAGVVHRDLKPANIMIGADGEALIMDFGIARSSGTAPKSIVVDVRADASASHYQPSQDEARTMAPASPQPFMPSGLDGQGVTVSPTL